MIRIKLSVTVEQRVYVCQMMVDPDDPLTPARIDHLCDKAAQLLREKIISDQRQPSPLKPIS